MLLAVVLRTSPHCREPRPHPCSTFTSHTVCDEIVELCAVCVEAPARAPRRLQVLTGMVLYLAARFEPVKSRQLP